jgi:hypothetical protein
MNKEDPIKEDIVGYCDYCGYPVYWYNDHIEVGLGDEILTFHNECFGKVLLAKE